MATNLFVRDMDLGVPNAHDNQRLEVAADGLPLIGGVQLALWCLQFSVMANRRGELPTRMVWHSNEPGGRKETTYPKLVQPGGRTW